MHNLWYIMNLTKRARDAIINGDFPNFLKAELTKRFPRGTAVDGGNSGKSNGQHGEEMPEWIIGALKGVGVDLFYDYDERT